MGWRVVLTAHLNDAAAGKGVPLAASWTPHHQRTSAYAMARIGLQTIPVVGALREVHS
jgi:hypothetical protein